MIFDSANGARLAQMCRKFALELFEVVHVTDAWNAAAMLVPAADAAKAAAKALAAKAAKATKAAKAAAKAAAPLEAVDPLEAAKAAAPFDESDALPCKKQRVAGHEMTLDEQLAIHQSQLADLERQVAIRNAVKQLSDANTVLTAENSELHEQLRAQKEAYGREAIVRTSQAHQLRIAALELAGSAHAQTVTNLTTKLAASLAMQQECAAQVAAHAHTISVQETFIGGMREELAAALDRENASRKTEEELRLVLRLRDIETHVAGQPEAAAGEQETDNATFWLDGMDL